MDLLRISVEQSPGNPFVRVHVERVNGRVLLHVDGPARIALSALATLIEAEAANVRL